MDELTYIDLVTTLTSANEAMDFFDEFYDHRNNYEQAYEAVRFSTDANGNHYRRGEVFGKEINSSLSKNASMADKMKYHGTGLLIRIYNAVAAIFKAIISVVKGILNIIVLPFFAAYKLISGHAPKIQSVSKMKDICNKASAKITTINEKIFDIYEGLIAEAERISNQTFKAAELLKTNNRFGGNISRNINEDGSKAKGLHIGYNANDAAGSGINDIKARVDNLRQSFENNLSKISKYSDESKSLRTKAFDEIKKIKEDAKPEAMEEIKKIEDGFMLTIIATPAVISRLRRMCNSIEKNSTSFVNYCARIAKKLKGEATEGVTKPSVYAAKVCDASATLSAEIVKSFNATLSKLQFAEGAKTFADAK